MASYLNDTAISAWQRAFLQRHQLAVDYMHDALKWFAPLAKSLAAHQLDAARPVLVGLNGCQGSGKTTLSDFLASLLIQEHGCNAIALSIDDFYLTAAQREALATAVHPLLRTRGVPGTHDMTLLHDTLKALLDAQRDAPVVVPRFNKAIDDRYPAPESVIVEGSIDVVILEGWCLGATAQSQETLSTPINSLERELDDQRIWRTYCNDVLEQQFPAIYKLIDQWVMLAAPSFDCVYRWRQEQERKLDETLLSCAPNQIMDDAELELFIAHYERITRDCLAHLPRRVDHLFRLDENRQIIDYTQPSAGVSQ